MYRPPRKQKVKPQNDKMKNILVGAVVTLVTSIVIGILMLELEYNYFTPRPPIPNFPAPVYESPKPVAHFPEINTFPRFEKKEKPFIIRAWDDVWSFNASSYDCLYAWPSTEKHTFSNDLEHFQSKTWSTHPQPSLKPAGIAFILLSTEKVVVKKILLYSKFKSAPNIKDFRFARLSDCGGGIGGSSTPQIIFKPIFLMPDKETYFPKILKDEDEESDFVTSLPYQMEADESLSIGFNFNGGSGEYLITAEIMATDFSGRDYNVTTPTVRFKRLIVTEKDLADVPILNEEEPE